MSSQFVFMEPKRILQSKNSLLSGAENHKTEATGDSLTDATASDKHSLMEQLIQKKVSDYNLRQRKSSTSKFDAKLAPELDTHQPTNCAPPNIYHFCETERIRGGYKAKLSFFTPQEKYMSIKCRNISIPANVIKHVENIKNITDLAKECHQIRTLVLTTCSRYSAAATLGKHIYLICSTLPESIIAKEAFIAEESKGDLAIDKELCLRTHAIHIDWVRTDPKEAMLTISAVIPKNSSFDNACDHLHKSRKYLLNEASMPILINACRWIQKYRCSTEATCMSGAKIFSACQMAEEDQATHKTMQYCDFLNLVKNSISCQRKN